MKTNATTRVLKALDQDTYEHLVAGAEADADYAAQHYSWHYHVTHYIRRHLRGWMGLGRDPEHRHMHAVISDRVPNTFRDLNPVCKWDASADIPF